jgi:TPR repeat protein
VALARLYHDPAGPMKNNELAARLFRLAADRGDARAQWELALMLQRGEGTARDLPSAFSLLKTSAAAGQGPAMNTLGFWARDGVDEPRNDAEAVKWFRQAAELRNEYGLANLGDMYWYGLGGLAVDHVEAVHLWRKSAYYDNPWGRLWLARALEKGDGVPRDIPEALTQYRAVANQNREPDAKNRATEAIARLTR